MFLRLANVNYSASDLHKNAMFNLSSSKHAQQSVDIDLKNRIAVHPKNENLKNVARNTFLWLYETGLVGLG